MKTKHEITLLEILAAMLPGGGERTEILKTLKAPEEDAETDGDLYRISSDDPELAHWAGVIRHALEN